MNWLPHNKAQCLPQALTALSPPLLLRANVARPETVRSLLLINADAGERRLVSAVAARAGWIVIGASTDEMALECLSGQHGQEIEAALLGSWDSNRGPETIRQLRGVRASLPVIVLAGEPGAGAAIEAMRAGASDFLARPVAPERLLDALAVHSDRRRATGELAPLAEKLAPALSLTSAPLSPLPPRRRAAVFPS